LHENDHPHVRRKHGIVIQKVATKVTLDRNLPKQTVFQYELELSGELTEEQRRKLLLAANSCPVRRTLSKTICFKNTSEV
jgi:putative redox protein